MRISTSVRNSTGSSVTVTVASTIYNPGGRKVARGAERRRGADRPCD
ncbi:MAG: hypothetical protein MZV63_48930 [Marinilabiliales bacterium]|nr:hypothetical protein [Marinilabiliales bacterium]